MLRELPRSAPALIIRLTLPLQFPFSLASNFFMKNTITKVVIPAAGFGTRFLPQTKAMPKEMLPIVDKPVIQYVVEEAVNSGEKYIEEITKIAEMANFIYIRQKGPYGNGTPVLTAEPIIGNEPFAVMWGDEFIYAKPPRLKQMIDAWNKYGGVMISGVRIETKDHLSRYGIADLEPIDEQVYRIKRIVEKPLPANAPSNLATHGAYILPPEIFPALKNLKPGKNGEIWLVDAINELKKQGIPIYACEIKNGKYYDTGNKLEYLKTVIEFAIQHSEINGEFRRFLKSLSL